LIEGYVHSPQWLAISTVPATAGRVPAYGRGVRWLDIIGWAGSALLIWSLLQTRILRLRVINLVGCLVLIVYNWVLHVWPMVGLNIVLAGINTYFLRTLHTTRHDREAYAVAEVPLAGELVALLLAQHAEDIAAFNPGFRQPDDGLAFVVLAGEEVAGLVLLHERGDGVAQIDLDYVVPRFRDFTPGEFVFRASGVLAARGFRSVRSRPGMIAPYYERLGFRADGDAYRLDMA
jgi:hypothetical protein